ncbi:hypothetical protein FACS1894172_13440 [Spirochaetia bacterium]|nr:hypothetical protein FACS1894172_13440 [Spirochaetia bacterium]
MFFDMKKIIILLMMFALFAINGYSQQSNTDEGLDIAKLFSFKYDKPINPDAEQLSIVRYILSRTFENNIHKMRGEKENKVYTNKDGREAVYDKNGNLVTNSYNLGTYNYGSYDEPIQKFLVDIAPWLLWGSTRDDPTSFDERLYYYTLDLNYGIQSFIFEGSNEQLGKVDFSKLSNNEKEVYYIFLHILFNSNYSIKLIKENLKRLHDDGDYYWQYFYQIQEVFGVKL